MKMKSIKIKLGHMSELFSELDALRLKPEKHYNISYELESSYPILEFTDPKHETLWRIAVGYKYT
jgi:hypothetical protein